MSVGWRIKNNLFSDGPVSCIKLHRHAALEEVSPGLFIDRKSANSREREPVTVHEWSPPASATFHGRDIFAPVAAALAQGTAPELMGPTIQNPVPLQPNAWDPTADVALAGSIIHIDRFG